ncbi:hypothetical protein KPH14_002638 [Odynerus spinipes]|uniref:HAT C-terminal dimerisation domain-containing protein n=1 Tax=Odynerus spinipes TaxID=1348599 RepID=A0AAD9RHY4_9HYME|nr:hypothetical protein KPH14_002638 [Odynerus spinipes]
MFLWQECFLTLDLTSYYLNNKSYKPITNLIRTWQYKQKIQKEHQTLRHNCTPNTSTACENEYEADEVKKMLRNLDNQKRGNNTSLHSLDIMNMLRKFLEYPRLDSKENILEFWDRNKNNIPELYSLAKIALSVPPTQVSVERLFSSLKYILSYLRYNLSDNILDDILMLRVNTKDINL